jgi:hypothetical protein
MAANSGRKETPSFFDDDGGFDPLAVASQVPKRSKPEPQAPAKAKKTSIEVQKPRTVVEKKKKVGFYFKPSNIERYEKLLLKTQLDGHWKGKTSTFMETILEYGLKDLESENSQILERLKQLKE